MYIAVWQWVILIVRGTTHALGCLVLVLCLIGSEHVSILVLCMVYGCTVVHYLLAVCWFISRGVFRYSLVESGVRLEIGWLLLCYGYLLQVFKCT